MGVRVISDEANPTVSSNAPLLPARIGRLAELAYDLWWTWHREGRQVFRLLDYPLWRLTAHNPVRMLRTLSRGRLEEVTGDQAFLAVYDAAIASLEPARVAKDSWWVGEFADGPNGPIAYFSAEFAVHQSLPIYAGGLGVLAGDHCKEAGDLGLPLVGVGFMYPQGYFHQHMSAEGWQEEGYETLNWADAPIERAMTPQGKPCVVSVPVAQRTIQVQVWRVRLGRVSLYLLDTHLDDNAPADRELSARLYSGTQNTRLQQEIILGVGGARVLRAMEVDPAVWHLNEGHSAFVVLERLRDAVGRGEPFQAALDRIRRTMVFTTHTPVLAGHDAFPTSLVDEYLAGGWDGLVSHREAFLALGRHDAGDGPRFDMTALALRTAGRVNGVSRRHGEVTRQMWAPVRAGVAPDVSPITSITNGVHVPTWIAPDLAKLFERWLGPDWRERQDDRACWDRLLDVPDEDVWAVRQALRSYLFSFLRERARQLWSEGHVTAARIAAAGVLLDPNALTIGYARRFTSYKRPELIFHDEERLSRILGSTSRPVQLLFAGKSHPADRDGKEQLRRVFARALNPRFGGRVAFLEDYDLHLAHFLVQGCDVWLNTPREPLEASGTSGMKAAMNGVPHLSIGDGWWAEGYTGSNGWVIRGGADSRDSETIDAADAAALHRLLEESVVPTFWDRDAQGIPRRWVRIVKEAIRTTVPHFSARRMVKQYSREMYLPALREAPKGVDAGVLGIRTPAPPPATDQGD